ncbi:hypothetical protein CBM2606_A180016 [Cupriavidus taiwanensis]|nr:hypothetical protein CBM2606_A180016 [Cupriavidus taiwanensis]
MIGFNFALWPQAFLLQRRKLTSN